ncbi:immunoglobulin kappa light chain-like isoform X1 [Podarcis muralis]
MAAFNSSLWLIRLFLQLHLFLQTPGVVKAESGEEPELYDVLSDATLVKVKQEPKFLSASPGESITLHCQLTRAIVHPTVSWYKESQALDTGTDSRVRRLHPDSQTDFSILIPNIELQDAGTYYCTKEIFGMKRKGKGSVVSVVVPPKVWLKMDPPSSVRVNDTVTVTCYVEGFYPRYIIFNWLKDREKTPLEAPVFEILNQDGTFSLRSSLEVTATKRNSSSVFTCRVVHTSQPPISKSAVLKVLSSTGEGHLFSSSAFWIGFIVNKVIAAFLLLCLFLRKQHRKRNP